MATLTMEQIYLVALQAGFPPDRATVFAAIAMAESGGRADAHNDSGEDSRGLWQINVGVHTNTWGDLFDPLTNARAALELSDGGRLLQPWSVTHDTHAGTARDYRTYLPEAEQAAANVGVTPVAAAAAALPDSPPLLPGGEGLVQPVPGATLTDTWGAPRSGGRGHEGIDIFADEGTPIHAISGGTVVKGFTSTYGGNVVRIEGDDGRYYYYAHLESVADLAVGQRVPTGAVIGTVGDTGNAAGTPPHLHLQVKQDGEWINPYDFLQGLADPAPAAAAAAYEVDTGVPPMADDADEDGLTDEFELLLGTDPADADSDDDGLSDLYETTVSHTDPLSADTDGDGAPDALEVAEGTDAGTVPLPDAALAAGFGGGDMRDSDDDGLSDLYEIEHGLDPYSADTDEDSLPDALEVALGSSPLSNDSDRDGIVDGWEHELGTLEPVDVLDPLSQAPTGSVDHAGHDHDHGDDEAADLGDGSGSALEDLAAGPG